MLAHAGDASKRAWGGNNTGTLADMVVAPDSVDRIAAIVARGTGQPFADALRRTIMQAPVAVR
jgi:hypothetical protein